MQLYIAFAIDDDAKRHALLRQAVKARWTDKQLHQVIQERNSSNRRGVGGRPRRPITEQEPEAALHKIERHCRNWLANFEGGWSSVEEARWASLVEACPSERREKLRDLLVSTDAAVQEVLVGCKVVRAVLRKMMGQAKSR
jgi:hypothetical protein